MNNLKVSKIDRTAVKKVDFFYDVSSTAKMNSAFLNDSSKTELNKHHFLVLIKISDRTLKICLFALVDLYGGHLYQHTDHGRFQ